MRDKILAAIKQHEDDGWDPYGNHRDYSFDAEQAADAVMEVVSAQWISVEDRLPELIQGKDYSENVLAWCDGRLMVMNLWFGPCENDKGEECFGYLWGNCYGDINGDGESDSDYEVTHWMPLPKSPQSLTAP